MNNIKQDYVSLTQNPRVTDLQYCDFYYLVINRLINFDNVEIIGYLKRYFQLAQPKRCFGSEVRDIGFEDEDIRPLTNTLFFRAIHVYRSGLLMSSAVDFHFRNLFIENPNLLQKILKKRVLKICSIGGRLPSDLVALVTVLESVAKEIDLSLDIRVTVLEEDENWKNTCFAILDCLKSFRKETWKTQFILSNLPDFDEPKCTKAIGEADIVTMVKFYSEFKDMPVDLYGVMEKVNHMMRPGSLLFYLDISKDNVIEFCGGPSGVLQYSQLVYEELCDLHALDPDAVERNFFLYYNKLTKPYYSKYLNSFARVWLKMLPDSQSKNLTENGNYALTHTLREFPYQDIPLEEYKVRREQNFADYDEISALEMATLDTSTEEFNSLEMKNFPVDTKDSTLKMKDIEQRIIRFESRYRRREKYNPQQNFLSAKSFEAWEKIQVEESKKLGRSKLGTQKYILIIKENRNIFLGQLMQQRKKLNSIRQIFIRNSIAFSGDYDVMNKNEWMKYVNEKRSFSAFKLKVYSFTLDLLCKRLERLGQTVTKKKKKFFPKQILIPITELCPNYKKMYSPHGSNFFN